MDWGREEGFLVAVADEPPLGEGAFGKVKNGQGECGDGGAAWPCYGSRNGKCVRCVGR